MKQPFMLTPTRVGAKLNAIIEALPMKKQFTYTVSPSFDDIKKSSAKYMVHLHTSDKHHGVRIFTQSYYGKIPALLYDTGLFESWEEVLNQIKRMVNHDDKLHPVRINHCAADICKHYVSLAEFLKKAFSEDVDQYNKSFQSLVDRLTGRSVASVNSDPLQAAQKMISHISLGEDPTLVKKKFEQTAKRIQSTERSIRKNELQHIFNALIEQLDPLEKKAA